MRWLYTLFICCYGCSIRIAGLFNAKAALWAGGRKKSLRQHRDAFAIRRPCAWFHCASLGEFEQGRPVIEAFRREHPGYRIILTFFSPSGYEVRKDYPGADVILYLPEDLPWKVSRFLDLARPDIVFFIKYEYWFNYIHQLHRRNIPIVVISAVFRENQYFFRWHGRWSANQLRRIRHFFVQHASSIALLGRIGIRQASVSGDTRFDRVAAIAGQPGRFPVMEEYRQGQQVLLAGSTWPEDEQVLFPLIRENRAGTRYIIAPHEISEDRILSILAACGVPAIRVSIAGDSIDPQVRLVVVDTMGQLSGLYRYADAAFIGGGFGKGIHNILEASTFGVPVLFGPNYHKFIEAKELLEKGGAFMVRNTAELSATLKDWEVNPAKRVFAGETARQYVVTNTGATQRIMDYLKQEGLA